MVRQKKKNADHAISAKEVAYANADNCVFSNVPIYINITNSLIPTQESVSTVHNTEVFFFKIYAFSLSIFFAKLISFSLILFRSWVISLYLHLVVYVCDFRMVIHLFSFKCDFRNKAKGLNEVLELKIFAQFSLYFFPVLQFAQTI